MKSGGRVTGKLVESVFDDSVTDDEPVAGSCVELIDPDGVICAEVLGASVDVDAASVEPVVAGAVAELASVVVELELSVDGVLAAADSFVGMDVVVVAIEADEATEADEVMATEADEIVAREVDVVFCVDIDVAFCVDIDVVFFVDVDVVCVVDVCEILLLSTATWQFVRVEAVDKVFFSQHWPS